MQRLHENISAVHQRQQRQWMWHCLSSGLLIGGVAGCVLAVSRFVVADPISISWIVAGLIVGPGLGLIYAMIKPRRIQAAAVEIDRQCGLKDRVASAMDFVGKQADSPIHQLQIDDAKDRIAGD